MRARTAWLVALALLVPIGVAQPARAQAAYYWLELGRTAFAVWEDKSTQSFALVVVGEGIIINGGEPLVGEVGCAHVENAERAAYACGELSHLDINDDLGTATAGGTFAAEVFDFKTERTRKHGTISLSGTWTAQGLLRPSARGRYVADGAFATPLSNRRLGATPPTESRYV